MRSKVKMARSNSLLVMIAVLFANKFAIGQATAVVFRDESGSSAAPTMSQSSTTGEAAPAATPWQYGGFIDAAYLLDFNHPANDLFRSRGTAYKVDEPIVNMAAAYIRKSATESSRWGLEMTAQAGQDTRIFGFSATAPPLPGSKGLRHLGPTNFSYLAPAGKGLTIQAGIFSSLIGYDTLYTKDNFNYTRPWGADFTPYLMLGVNASYPFTSKLTGTVFVINGYWHLGNANEVPSWGGQLAYKPKDHWTLKQAFLIGPHQPETAFEFWRVLSDSIVEWKREPFTVAFEYQGASEKGAASGNPRAAWMAAQLPMHWTFNRGWSATVRPEVAWDSDGRWTGFPQTVKAVTSTLEYRVPFRQATAIFRLEYRFDDSRGSGGGFFRGREIFPGIVGLTPSQHLLGFAAIFTFDGQIQRRTK
jgi:putative OmpL-like beta-barrel porin-2